LFFVSPLDFNDPFDCQISLPVQATNRKYRLYLQRWSKGKRLWLNRQQRRAAISTRDQSLFEKAYRKTLKEHTEKAGLVCFSETNDDILLWSHYADKHSGVCLEFAVQQDDLLKEKTAKVNYSREYPDLNFFDVVNAREKGELTENQERDLTTALFLTKSEHWRYEKEWRTVEIPKSQSFRGQHRISPRALSGVILGCRTSSADEKKMQSWVASSPSRLSICRARRKEKSLGWISCLREIANLERPGVTMRRGGRAARGARRSRSFLSLDQPRISGAEIPKDKGHHVWHFKRRIDSLTMLYRYVGGERTNLHARHHLQSRGYKRWR
jgi:hypothetical protein